jgi:hypothetical protein
MNKRLRNSILSRAVIAGAVIAACVGGTALPASAAADSDPAASTIIYTGSGTAHAQWGIALDEREIYQDVAMKSVVLEQAEVGMPKLVAKWDIWQKNSIASASYSIVDNRHSSGYYVVTTIHGGYFWDWARAWSECQIYKGRPASGGKVVTDSPYACDTTRRQADNDWDYMVWKPNN